MKELKRPVVKPFAKASYEVVEAYNFEVEIKLKPLFKKNQNENSILVKDTIPKGYETDGASIPRLFWSLYPPFKSEYFSAALIHDYLCSKAAFEKDKKQAFKIADEVLFEVMRSLKVDRKTCYIFYFACSFYHFLKYKSKKGFSNAKNTNH